MAFLHAGTQGTGVYSCHLLRDQGRQRYCPPQKAWPVHLAALAVRARAHNSLPVGQVPTGVQVPPLVTAQLASWPAGAVHATLQVPQRSGSLAVLVHCELQISPATAAAAGWHT